MTIGEGGASIEANNLANNKLPHGFIRKLVDQKVGYLLSKALSIQTENTAYEDLLKDFFNKSFLRLLQSVGREAINKGKAWVHIYYSPTGKLSLKRIPSEECIPLWRDAAHTELDALIRVYEVEVYEGKTKKVIKKIEFWDTAGVKRFVLDGVGMTPDIEAGDSGTHFTLVEGEDKQVPLNWERVPFVCFKYHEDELTLVKFVQALVDDYDRKKSDNSNNLDDLPNSVYVIKNYDGQDLGEFRRNLSVFRAVKVMDDGAVETQSLDIDTEAYKTHQEMNRKDIYEFGRGVDTQSDKFGNSPSGIALKFLYQDLDLDANDIETEFQASLEQLRWFIDTHLANSGLGDFSEESVDFILNRDILINEMDTITNAKNSVGVISEETIVANHPWVTNAQDEMKRLESDRMKAMDDLAYEAVQDGILRWSRA
ncbi:phage portal protein [Bacillus sp. 3255]|uniref:phage portal protein n=2 Tax=Bacillales TaxID=1385 RepID=UPI00285D88A8|nr:phage portal protein [Bacillus sp. 3255]MDR6880369.1 SPP1 family phage portal protein [Bacillus sp. 3255]